MPAGADHSGHRRWESVWHQQQGCVPWGAGEDLAAAHLESLGWRCLSGELDIISWDQEARTIVVMEAKSRSSQEIAHSEFQVPEDG